MDVIDVSNSGPQHEHVCSARASRHAGSWHLARPCLTFCCPRPCLLRAVGVGTACAKQDRGFLSCVRDGTPGIARQCICISRSENMQQCLGGCLPQLRASLCPDDHFHPTDSKYVQYSASRKPLQSIDGAYVINLSRRPDRLQRFMANSSFSRESVHVFDAFDGQALKWSSGIETLFGTNKFNDARGMIGCALSHFAIWRHIATTENEFHAIFEDDAIFVEDFVAQWNARHSYALPFDADLVYLGGVLESNREHYGSAVQPLNKLFARHRATNFFTHNLDAVPSGGAGRLLLRMAPPMGACSRPARGTLPCCRSPSVHVGHMVGRDGVNSYE